MTTAPATIDCRTSAALGLLLLFEQRSPRDDEVSATVFVFGDSELVDLPLVRRRVSIAERVDLRERAEGAQAADAHFIPALDRAFNFALDWKTRVEGVFELPRGRCPPRQPARQGQPAHGRKDDGLNTVAYGGLELAVSVL